ncbi:MAG: hypothetical protein KKE23_02835 [Nanoarchaeota archaeon]|nr:hypothetical protein [Nanoarchaeota archaeon]
MKGLNKKGQVLSSALTLGWKLFLIAGITLFVALTVGSIFTAKQDIRPAEVSILANKVMECITNNGIIEPNFNLNGCFIEDNELYVSANLTSIESNFSRFIFSGKQDLGVFCKIPDMIKEGTVYCIDQKYYVLINNQKIERGMLELTVGVKKYESNI